MNEIATERFREAYESFLPLPHGLEPNLRGALQHVLQRPGNLARPKIVFQAGTAFGLNTEYAMDLAIGLEYFHTASLIFDDLPSMDGATERRGATCVHIAYGESSAILAALALINRAYALTWRAIFSAATDPQRQAGKYLELHLGLSGLLNGQSLDLHYASLPHDQATSEKAAMGKTVSLIRLALVLPAILGQASQRELALLDRVAHFWGLAYQILDDLKDVLESEQHSGKTSGHDATLDRPNITFILGVDASSDRLQKLINLGSRSLRRLIETRPSLVFLTHLKEGLNDESVRLAAAHSAEVRA